MPFVGKLLPANRVNETQAVNDAADEGGALSTPAQVIPPSLPNLPVKSAQRGEFLTDDALISTKKMLFPSDMKDIPSTTDNDRQNEALPSSQPSYQRKESALWARIKGDMIEMFELMVGKSKVDFRKFFKLASVRLANTDIY